MKLLLDENLSPRLAALLAPQYPGTTQIELLGLRGASDTEASALDESAVSADTESL